jgi:hypothetical protein
MSARSEKTKRAVVNRSKRYAEETVARATAPAAPRRLQRGRRWVSGHRATGNHSQTDCEVNPPSDQRAPPRAGLLRSNVQSPALKETRAGLGRVKCERYDNFRDAGIGPGRRIATVREERGE